MAARKLTVFAQNLKRLRFEHKQMSQFRLADLTGIKAYRIQRLESALFEPTEDELKRIARVFKVTPESLMASMELARA